MMVWGGGGGVLIKERRRQGMAKSVVNRLEGVRGFKKGGRSGERQMPTKGLKSPSELVGATYVSDRGANQTSTATEKITGERRACRAGVRAGAVNVSAEPLRKRRFKPRR